MNRRKSRKYHNKTKKWNLEKIRTNFPISFPNSFIDFEKFSLLFPINLRTWLCDYRIIFFDFWLPYESSYNRKKKLEQLDSLFRKPTSYLDSTLSKEPSLLQHYYIKKSIGDINWVSSISMMVPIILLPQPDGAPGNQVHKKTKV